MAPRLPLVISLMIVSLLGSAIAGAAECSARSGPARSALVELYTSEGCSSCPPADRWLSGLAAGGVDGDRVVPLAFHVDYWDYIGWKDPFANPRYSERQREGARVNGSKFVYTPQVLLGGGDFSRWSSRGDFAARLAEINRRNPGADIALAARRTGEAGIEISATATLRGASSDAALYLALRENRLASEVKAGENSGHRLQHDYVVRELIGPIPFSVEGKIEARHTLALKPGWKRADLAVAAFVQERGSGEVLQTLALGACL